MSTDVREWTVLSMLEWGTNYFNDRDIPDPRLSIEWLLAEVLAIKRLDLYLAFDRPLGGEELQALRPLVKRRAKHEPLQYIIGHTEFMNARISVTPDVLIPRIETEQLVELILDRHPKGKSLSALDIGTGSGCIPIALQIERPGWQVHALDISVPALSLAKKNAEANDTDIFFHEGDITDWQNITLPNDLDIIISNPPYILPKEKDLLEPQVTHYEPHLALFCNSMEKMYGSIINFSASNLHKEGLLYLEVHEDYSELVVSLLNEKKWTASLVKDYEAKPRFVIAKPPAQRLPEA